MRFRKPSLVIALILSLSGSGCSFVKPTPLPLPARPILPTVPAESMTCLDQQTYSDLVERDTLLKAYAKELEAVIRSTQ